MNTIIVNGEGPVILRTVRTKPDGTTTISLEHRTIARGAVNVPDHGTDTIEAQVLNMDREPITLPFIFKPPMKMSKEYATEQSLNSWGPDGVYAKAEWVRKDGWTDELLVRDVTEWRKGNE